MPELLTAFAAAGSANGLILAGLIGRGGRHDPRNLLLALGLAIAATALAVIYAKRRVDVDAQLVLLMIEHTLTLASGPVLLLYIRRAMGRATPRGIALALLLPATVHAAGNGAALVFGFAPWIVPISALVGAQVCFTLFATLFVVVHRKRTQRAASPHDRFWPLAMLSTMWIIHLSQAMRFAAPESSALRDLVPVVGGLCLYAALAALLGRSRLPEVNAQTPYARSGLDVEAADALVKRIRALMESERCYRDRNLSLTALASRCGVPEHHVTAALSAAGESFQSLVARHRVTEAQRLLRAPSNAHCSVDGLGLEAGFGSRSAFYSAFRAATGLSPAEYRRRAATP